MKTVAAAALLKTVAAAADWSCQVAAHTKQEFSD